MKIKTNLEDILETLSNLPAGFNYFDLLSKIENLEGYSLYRENQSVLRVSLDGTISIYANNDSDRKSLFDTAKKYFARPMKLIKNKLIIGTNDLMKLKMLPGIHPK